MERRVFARFRELSGAVPAGTIDDDREAPDFLVATPEGRRIGIELEQYFRGQGAGGSHAREAEVFRRRAVEEAQRIFAANSGAAVWVIVHWHRSSRRIPRDLPVRLAALVERALPPLSAAPTPLTDRLCVGSDLGDLREAVLSVAINRTMEPIGLRWSSIDGEWINLAVEEVQSALDHKAGDIPMYRAESDEVWLVIWSDERLVSSSFRLDADVVEHVYTSDFDRAFLLRADLRR